MKKCILLALSLFFCPIIFAKPIDKIIFFGDSLTDNGNLYSHSFKIIPKSPPYYQGRFSNAPAWSDTMGDYYHDKYQVEAENYAVGGATAILRSPTQGALPVNMAEEIYDYFLRSSSAERSKTLYAIWIGSNDYLDVTEQDPESLTSDVVAKIVGDITSLVNKGGQYFLLIGSPDLSLTPYAKLHHTGDRLQLLSKMHNQKLSAAVDALKIQYPLLTFLYVDTFNTMSDIIHHPEKYNKQYQINLTNTAESCWEGGYTSSSTRNKLAKTLQAELQKAAKNHAYSPYQQVNTQALAEYIAQSPALAETYQMGKLFAEGVVPCANPDEYVFWDKLHPTGVIHRILADVIEKNITEAHLIE